MTNPFAITTTTTAVPLDGKRQGSVSFTVSNTSGRALRARARIVPANPAAAPWLTLDGPPERPLPAAGTEQWTVLIVAPPAAPQGTYAFRLDVVGVDNPDEELSSGPSVSFVVPAPAPPPKPFPWWIVVVAAVLLLAVVGGSIFFIGQNNGHTAATQTAVAATQTAAAGVVFRADSSVLRGTWTFNLENGHEGDPLAQSHIWWSQQDAVNRYLVPEAGTQMALLGKPNFAALTVQDLRSQSYSGSQINGSNNGANQLTAGTVIALRLPSGRYAKMRIDTYDYNLSFTYVTYQ